MTGQANSGHAGLKARYAVAIAVNILMGSGFFALPSLFSERQAGKALGCFFLICVGVIMYITCLWESAAVLLAQRLMKTAKVPEVTTAIELICGSGVSGSAGMGSFMKQDKNMFGVGGRSGSQKERDTRGRTALNLYLLVMTLSIFGSLVSYGILFSQSICTSLLGEEGSKGSVLGASYTTLAIIIFAVVTTITSFLKIEEQATIQLATATLRVVLVVLMASTSTLASMGGEEVLRASFPATVETAMAGPSESESLTTTASHSTEPLNLSMLLVKEKLPFATSCLSIVVFALFLNSCMSEIIDVLAKKRDIAQVVQWSMIISCCAYGLLSIAISEAFGGHGTSPANLNWDGFRLPLPWTAPARDGTWEVCPVPAADAAWFDASTLMPCHVASRTIELLILLFPAVDVFSVYRCCARSNTNYIMTYYFLLRNACNVFFVFLSTSPNIKYNAPSSSRLPPFD
jgi:hypothetical protein